jgi:hexulose-6-phosphate isomerase
LWIDFGDATVYIDSRLDFTFPITCLDDRREMMPARLNRRAFLATTAAAGAGIALAGRLEAAAAWKTTIHKGLIGAPTEAFLKEVKDAGFDGIESTVWQKSPQEAVAARQLAESLGLKIHSILFGWGTMNGGDAAMTKSVSEMETALQTAQGYGATTVLYVPCRIDVTPMPEPWEFDIRFDEKTNHIRQVVAGDNAKYQKYIDAHNHAIDTSREGVKRLIPMAEKTGVIVALENVWNNLWVKPEVAANFIASFDSPWVRAYFDIGNHVKYAPPQDWIHTLGKLIVKCHVKDFRLGPGNRGGGFANFCDIRTGSIQWPLVRKALDDIGYNSWMTIEGGSLSAKEHSKRLDLIIAGE